MKTCKDVMTASPRVCAPADSLADVAKLMGTENVGSIPVVDRDRLEGIITDRDITVRAVAEGKDPRQTRVRDVMTANAECVRADEPVDRALKLMEERQVRRVPVIDGSGKLVGIIAQADVATRLGDDAETGEMVEAISKPE